MAGVDCALCRQLNKGTLLDSLEGNPSNIATMPLSWIVENVNLFNMAFSKFLGLLTDLLTAFHGPPGSAEWTAVWKSPAVNVLQSHRTAVFWVFLVGLIIVARILILWQKCHSQQCFLCIAACEIEKYFQCANSQCIPYSFICDADDDCGDYSDERICSDGAYWNAPFVVKWCWIQS